MDGLVACAGLCLEDVIHSVVAIAIVVDNDQQVAGAVVVIGGVELEVVPSLSTVERTCEYSYTCGGIKSNHIA